MRVIANDAIFFYRPKLPIYLGYVDKNVFLGKTLYTVTQ